MILASQDIEEAIKNGRLIVTPPPKPEQFKSSALDVRVGDDFRMWNDELFQVSEVIVDVDKLRNISDLLPYTKPMEPVGGAVHIAPGKFVMVRTFEEFHLTPDGQLAARVEGRSTLARLGMSVHITAPTIHAGFDGKIVLEIINHGPYVLKVWPNRTRLCQLIFEEVSSPVKNVLGRFHRQSTILGTPKTEDG